MVFIIGCTTIDNIEPTLINPLAMEPVVQIGHLGKINAVTLTKNDQIAVSTASDGTIKIWEIRTGRVVNTLDNHLKQKRVAAKKGVTARGQFLHTPSVNCIAISNDNRLILSGASDGNVIVSNLAGGQTLRVFNKHKKSVNTAVFTNGDRQALTGCSAGRIYLWEIASGRKLRQYNNKTGAILSLSLSPQYRIFVSGDQNGFIWLYDILGERKPQLLGQHQSAVSSVDFSTSGKYLLSAGWDGTIKLWDMNENREIRQIEGHEYRINTISFSPDENLILSGASDNTAKVWDRKTGLLVTTLMGHQADIHTAVFTNDGRYVITGSQDQTMKLWRIQTGKEIRSFLGPSRRIHSVSFSPDGRYLLSSMQGQINCWDVSTGSLVKIFRGSLYHQNMETRFSTGRHIGINPHSVGFSPDGLLVVSLGNDGTYKNWDFVTGKEILGSEKYPTKLSTIAYSPDGRLVVSKAGGIDLLLREYTSTKVVRRFSGHKQYISAVAYSPDGRFIISGDLSGRIFIWNTKYGKQRRELKGHFEAITSIDISPDGRLAATGSWDMTCRIWEVETGKEIVRMIASHDGEWITSTPDGFYVNSAEGNNLIHWAIDSDLETYSFEQFESLYDNSAIVAGRLDLNSPKDLKNLTIVKPPRIQIDNEYGVKSVIEKQYMIKVKASSSEPLKSLRLFLNGKPAFEAPLTAFEAEMEVKIPLVYGVNRITSIAYDVRGFSSNPKYVDIICQNPQLQRQNLHVFAIGISQYDLLPSSWQLQYAHTDAKAVIATFKKQEGKLFDRVTSTLMINESATEKAILEKLSWLQSNTDIDLIVVFMAGHGVKSPNGDFYFLTTDSRVEYPQSGGLNWNLLKDRLQLKNGRVALFLDACHSGSIVNETIVPNDEMAHQLFIGQRGGIMVFSASKGRQYSMESPDIGGGFGVFTYALTQAIGNQSKDADINGNNVVEFMELVTYVTRYVDKLTGGNQTPWLSRKELFGDLPIAVVSN